jgi:uncharacterized protein YyaL (SSP411 family)
MSSNSAWPVRIVLGLAFLIACQTPALAEPDAAGPDWRSWSPQVFAQAKNDGRLVLLEVKAEWCAACRKMEASGFRDPRVLETIDRHYLPVRADIDQEPEIMRRYGEGGVPGVVILNADGVEILARHGYLEPDWLYWLLLAVADDPRPEAHR